MIWLVMILGGIFTFGTRFVMLSGWVAHGLPRWLIDALAFVPIAVLNGDPCASGSDRPSNATDYRNRKCAGCCRCHRHDHCPADPQCDCHHHFGAGNIMVCAMVAVTCYKGGNIMFARAYV